MKHEELWESFCEFPPIHAVQSHHCKIIGTIAAIAGIASAAAGVGGAAIASHAAGKAAETQSEVAMNAAQLERQTAKESLDWQKEMWNQVQGYQEPYRKAGESGLDRLMWRLGIAPEGKTTTTPGYTIPGQPATGSIIQGYRPPGTSSDFMSRPEAYGMVGRPATPDTVVPAKTTTAPGYTGDQADFGSLLQPFGETWQAPTEVTMQNDPGYQFRLAEGTKALERSAAAKGGLLTGGTAKALERYGQDYGNVYNRALTDYGTRFNVHETENADIYNRLASLAGLGQTTANTLSSTGLQSATNQSNIAMNSAAQQSQQLNNAAAARASGYVGGANAWSQGLGNIGGSITDTLLLNQLLKNQK
jgi:hypothetical protein